MWLTFLLRILSLLQGCFSLEVKSTIDPSHFIKGSFEITIACAIFVPYGVGGGGGCSSGLCFLNVSRNYRYEFKCANVI